MKKLGLTMALACFGLAAFCVLGACSQVGLLQSGDGTAAVVAIPRVILNCQTSQCRTNVASPLINVLITTSPCTSPEFGGTVSSSTRSISCNGTSGCYGEVGAWVSTAGSATTLNAGTYNICACINYSGTSGNPWSNCNSLGERDNVAISSATGLQMISTWTDN